MCKQREEVPAGGMCVGGKRQSKEWQEGKAALKREKRAEFRVQEEMS